MNNVYVERLSKIPRVSYECNITATRETVQCKMCYILCTYLLTVNYIAVVKITPTITVMHNKTCYFIIHDDMGLF